MAAHYEVHEEIPEEEAPPPPPRLWPWLVALLLLVLAGLGGLWWATRDDDAGAAAPATTAAAAGQVQVPAVEGEPLDDATAALAAAGLEPKLARAPSERPSGIVLEQDPAAGRSVDRGSTVTLTISRGEATISVPDVRRLPAARAFAELEQARLTPSSRRVYADAPVGEVVAQKPGPGNEVEPGTEVALTVSRGEREVEVPDVTGRDEAEAVAALEDAGLTAGSRRVPSGEPAGTVVAQNPRAGERAAKGSKVQINVSAGAAGTTTSTTTSSGRVTVPDVVGLKRRAAVGRLRGAGLEADTKPIPSDEPEGTVVAQFPAAGTQARRGGSIRINVSAGRAAREVPDVVGDDELTATDRLEEAGFVVEVVRQDTSAPEEDGVVLEQDPLPGDKRKPGTTVTVIVGTLTG